MNFLNSSLQSSVECRSGGGAQSLSPQRPKPRFRGFRVVVSNGTIISRHYVTGQGPIDATPHLFNSRKSASLFIEKRRQQCQAERVACLFDIYRYRFEPVYGF